MEWVIALFILANAARTTPLVYDEDMAAIAQQRALYLCETTDFSHVGWQAWSFQVKNAKHVGENLGISFKTAKGEHKAFMKSPTHRENIVNEAYDRMGAAHVICPKGSQRDTVDVVLFADSRK